MKARLTVTAVCVPLLLVVIYLCPFWATVVLISLLSLIGTYELLNSAGLVKNVRLTAYCLVFSAGVPFWCYLGSPMVLAQWGLFSLFLLLFLEAIFSKHAIVFEAICTAIFGSVLLPYFLSAFVRIGMGDYGRIYILVPLASAFLSDGAALFSGMAWGKHKLAPDISPKKTVEGAVGGFVGGLLGTVIYGIVARSIWQVDCNLLYFAVYGALGAIVSVFGDLSFSLIKRQYGIKDYGNLLPGHGGVLDRFDSVIFAAPLTELLIVLLPAIKG